MTGILLSAIIAMPLLILREGARLCHWPARTAEKMPMPTQRPTVTRMNVCKPVHAIVDMFKLVLQGSERR